MVDRQNVITKAQYVTGELIIKQNTTVLFVDNKMKYNTVRR